MAGRDISCTHVALGTVRVMRTTGMMGEVVGMAAALCIKNGCLPRGVYQHHLPELKRMMEAGAGRTDVPLSDQDFNLPNTLLKNAPVSDKGYARLSCDTLFIGNSLIERAFRWNGGNLTNVYMKDKTTGRVFVSDTGDPALAVGQSSGAAADGMLAVREVKSDGIRPEHLEAEVTFPWMVSACAGCSGFMKAVRPSLVIIMSAESQPEKNSRPAMWRTTRI